MSYSIYFNMFPLEIIFEMFSGKLLQDRRTETLNSGVISDILYILVTFVIFVVFFFIRRKGTYP